LTIVAGTAVLGDRIALFGATWAGYALLLLAVGLWIGLVPRAIRGLRTPTVGVSFMLTVATESIAVLAAVLALERRVAWLAVCALAPFVIGLAAYPFVLVRADLKQLLVGHGDQWIFGGALAIATLACARSSAALNAASTLAAVRPALRLITLALWAAAAAWLPVLLTAELRAPRLRYDLRRWSTVFPIGMYAVCSSATSSVGGIGGIGTFADVWIWIALAVWAIVLIGTLRHGAGGAGRGTPA
jgi:tellurite resistance protein TehA-like permease